MKIEQKALTGIDLRPLAGNEKSAASEISHNMTLSDGVLRPVTLNAQSLFLLDAKTEIIGLHENDGYRHLILHRQSTGIYFWVDITSDMQETSQGGTPLNLDGRRVTGMAAVDDIITMTTDDGPVYVVWMSDLSDYRIMYPESLGYDLIVSQDQQREVTAELKIDSKLHPYLKSPEAPLRSRPTIAVHLLNGGYDDGSYATGATLIRSAAEGALDQHLSDDSTLFKHIVFGIAALRLFDGSHHLLSPVFALLPAKTTDTVMLQPNDGTLTMNAWLHRHTVTATLRNMGMAMTQLVRGIDIFLSKPVTFTDPHLTSTVTRDAEGNVTSLTFPYLGQSQTEAVYRSLDFHLAMHISHDELGQEIMLSRPSTSGGKLDLSTSGLIRYGANTAYTFGHRLHIADVTPVMGNPLQVGIRYRFATLTVTERLGGADRDGELLAGFRPDIGYETLGTTAETVIIATLDDSRRSRVFYNGLVQYPLPGALQIGSRHVTDLEVHLAVELDGTLHYYKMRNNLSSNGLRDISDTAYAISGGSHRSSRPAFHSLLMQQVRAVAYDSESGTYQWSHDLWTEEIEADFDAVAARAREQWLLTRQPSCLMWSEKNNPLFISEANQTDIGMAAVRQLAPGTRRTANGLIGEYPLYAITDEGIWALKRDKKDHWSASQPLTTETPLPGTQVVEAGESVFFIGSGGIMRLKGNTLTCISEAINPLPENIVDGGRLCCDTERGFLLLLPGGDVAERWMEELSEGEAYLYNISSGAWSTVSHSIADIMAAGAEWWGVTYEDGRFSLGRICIEAPAANVIELISRPISLRKDFGFRRLRGVRLCGRFGIPTATVLRMLVEGSVDGDSWHCIGTGNTVVSGVSGNPYRWFRLSVHGTMQGSDYISAIRIA